MHQLLAALGKDIKAAGRDKWTARCPVHNDKDFAMSIKLNADNSVMAHCHACGANGLMLYDCLGLSLDELFGKERDSNDVPQMIRDRYDEDRFILAIYKADSDAGIPISWGDKKRHKLAVHRAAGIERKYGDRL